MTFAQSPASRIVPIGLPEEDKVGSAIDMEMMYQTVQHRQTLVIQQFRQWRSIQPDWYPCPPPSGKRMGIWFGSDRDEFIEQNGWTFVRKGAAYAAVRPVLWDEVYEREHKRKTSATQTYFNAADDSPAVRLREKTYHWNKDRTIMILEDFFSPVVIQAGRTADYPAMADFMTNILANPPVLYKTVVPGSHILVHTGCGEQAEEIVFNAANPQIPDVDGRPVNYSFPMTFDSPYLQSDYLSGRVRIQCGGERLNLNFVRLDAPGSE
jgi:hypothetical protein